jgi:hypothetical protein
MALDTEENVRLLATIFRKAVEPGLPLTQPWQSSHIRGGP